MLRADPRCGRGGVRAVSTSSTAPRRRRSAALKLTVGHGTPGGWAGQQTDKQMRLRRCAPGRAVAPHRYFGLKEQGTDIRTEFIAGLTTFLTMVYIVFVNPAILSKAGMDPGAVFVATCVAAAVSTMVMALYANYPIALAPGMGINAFFAFTVVLTYKYTWQQALAAVFCSGVLFFLISVVPHPPIRQTLSAQFEAGASRPTRRPLFLGIIALEESRLLVAHPATLVTAPAA